MFFHIINYQNVQLTWFFHIISYILPHGFLISKQKSGLVWATFLSEEYNFRPTRIDLKLLLGKKNLKRYFRYYLRIMYFHAFTSFIVRMCEN